MKIGFIGLGIMGEPMAGHLIAAKHQVFLYNVPSVPNRLCEAGGVVCANCREVAEHADVIFMMLPDTRNVEDVLFSENGVAKGLKPGKTVVDMSSISPIATKEFARRIGEFGCGYLDAPVSGGQVGAQNATLSIMVGGSEATFLDIKPLFEVMGKTITLIGESGDGQTAKVANQILVALNLEAACEALLFVSKAGADPEKVHKALLGGAAYSKCLENQGARIIKRNFEPGFRIALHQKDLNIALSCARELGVSLPNTAMAQELFNSCAAYGGKDWDHSAMVKALEMMANFEVGKKA